MSHRFSLEPLFDLGRCVATPAALAAFENADNVSTWTYIKRHVHGDWGDMDASDKKANDDAVKYGLRVFSAYTLPTGVRIWVITEADRSSTCVLLPSDY